MKFLKCEICGERIATFYPEQVSRPIRGEMFFSKDRVHGWPEPFEPGLAWQWFRCPYGGHRPFMFFPKTTEEDAKGPSLLLTEEGYLDIDVPKMGTIVPEVKDEAEEEMLIPDLRISKRGPGRPKKEHDINAD